MEYTHTQKPLSVLNPSFWTQDHVIGILLHILDTLGNIAGIRSKTLINLADVDGRRAGAAGLSKEYGTFIPIIM